jgi:hypothetical protein
MDKFYIFCNESFTQVYYCKCAAVLQIKIKNIKNMLKINYHNDCVHAYLLEI